MQELLERTIEKLKKATESAPKIHITKEKVLSVSASVMQKCSGDFTDIAEKNAFRKTAQLLEKKLIAFLFMKQDDGYIAYNDFTSVMASLMNSCPIETDLDKTAREMFFSHIYTTEMTAQLIDLPPDYMQKVMAIQDEFFKEIEKYEI